MNTDALSDLVRTVDDDSSPEHKAIFILWATLDDIADDDDSAGKLAGKAIKRAADALSRSQPSTVDPEGR